MTEELISIASAFTVGLMGSVHCIGMCGGIASALGVSSGNDNTRSRWLYNVLYNVGRLISYAFMGGVLGWLIHLDPHAMHGMGDGEHHHQGVSVGKLLSGALLIAMGLYLAGWWYGLVKLEKLGHILWRRIQPLTQRVMPVDRFYKALCLGLLWGWLPCGLVYSALAFSATQDNTFMSAATMFAFGLGTAPALVVSGVFAQQVQTFSRRPIVRHVMGALILAFGLWTVSSALGLSLPL
ncbi:sulfite exporter TauE/SafE family protein [Aurantivibrio plasticivorans]